MKRERKSGAESVSHPRWNNLFHPHLVERCVKMVGMTGWSILLRSFPFLSCWLRERKGQEDGEEEAIGKAIISARDHKTSIIASVQLNFPSGDRTSLAFVRSKSKKVKECYSSSISDFCRTQHSEKCVIFFGLGAWLFWPSDPWEALMITHLMILNHISSWYLNTKSSNLVLLLSWAREEEKKKAFTWQCT